MTRSASAGSRSQLLPSLTATASLNNNALVGQSVLCPYPRIRLLGSLIPTFSEDTGRRWVNCSAIISRTTPQRITLNVPLRNRSARADMILDQLTVRQQEIAIQQVSNQVRVDVQNALIALQQSRAVYQAAVKTRILREQTLDAEQKKLALGASTIYNVILIQRDLAQSQSDEVNALSSYSRAQGTTGCGNWADPGDQQCFYRGSFPRIGRPPARPVTARSAPVDALDVPI